MSGRDSDGSERGGAARIAGLLLVVLAGATGWLVDAGRGGGAGSASGSASGASGGAASAAAASSAASDGAPLVTASGPFWSLRDGDDRVLQVPADGAGLPLHPGQIFWLDASADGTRRYTDLSFRLGPGGAQSAYTDLRFGDSSATNFRFVFVPSQPPAGYLASRVGEGPWTELARGQAPAAPATGANGPGAGGTGPALPATPSPRAPCDLGVRLLPDAIETSWNGQPLVRAATAAAPVARRLALWADDARLLSVRAAGEESGAQGAAGDARTPRAVSFSDDFAWLARDAVRAARVRAALALGAAVALAALYLRSRCTRRPPGARLAQATLLLLAPAALPFAIHALHPLPADPRAVAAVLALPGLLLALWSLRAFGPLGVARRDGAPAPRTGLAGRVRGTLVVLALLGATAFAAAGAAGARAERSLRAAREWLPRLDAARFTLDAPRTLDLGNALPIPGVRRDFDLSARVTLSSDALLELRVHSPDDQPVAGLALCLRAGDAAGSGFFVENSYEFRRTGSQDGAAPAGAPFELALSLRGARAEARIDGRLVASAEEDGFPAGGCFLLAAAGTARIERLELQPVADGGSEPRPERDRALAALGAAALLLLLALLARALLGQTFPAALQSVAFVLVPLALGLHAADGDGRLPLLAAGLACAGAALLLLLHAPSLGLAAGAARTGLFVVLASAACAGALRLGIDLPADAPVVDSVRPHVFPGPRLLPDLVAFEHPGVRRLNGWLREHRFRGRSFPLAKPAGTLRVIAVGSSSTWGHGVPEESGLDYPTQLEGLLRDRLPGLTVEVINGGIPGGSSARSLRFFREVLLAFQPDLVTVSFAFNDAYHVTQLDEDAYLELITRPDYDHAAVESAEAAQVFAGKQRLNRLLALFAEHPGPGLPLWKQVLDETAGGASGKPPPGAWLGMAGERTPPERFAANLRGYARLCAERGVQLVLIKEPFRDDPPRLWKDEFYAAIDDVAREFHLPVVDPRPALAAQGGAALFLDEIHPAPAGHAVIARELLPVVAALLQERAAAGR